MGKLADDLERLTEEVGELREERANFLKELEANEATRREEAEEAGAERQSFVSGLKDDVGEMLEGFRAGHEEMGQDLRERLEANERSRKDDEATRKEEAEDACAERQSFVSSLKGDVGEMLEGFRAGHEEMGQDLRERLEANERSRKDDEATRKEEAEDACAERQAFVSGLKGDVGEMLDGFRAAHEEMGEQTRRQLSEVRSDLEAGRRAFFGPGPAEVKAEQERRRAEKGRKAKEKAARERHRAEEAKRHPDDLTVISGIGRKTQERLNQEGIYTYAQLAAEDPEEVCEHLEDLVAATVENVRHWIAEAGKLARE